MNSSKDTNCKNILKRIYYFVFVVLDIFFHIIFLRLRNLNGDVVFTSRIIHNVYLMTSVVHVFYYSQMAAVAHVIGTHQLPTESQVNLNISFL